MSIELCSCRLTVDGEGEARWGPLDEKIKKRHGTMARLIRVCCFPFSLQIDKSFDLVKLTEKAVEFLYATRPLQEYVVNIPDPKRWLLALYIVSEFALVHFHVQTGQNRS